MNKLLVMCVMALMLAACGKPAPIELVESLVANPGRLKELRSACKADHAKVGDAQCNVVAEATRQRFMLPSPSPYSNEPVKPSPPSASPAAKDGAP